MALSISVPSPLDWVPLQIPTESSTFWKVRVWFSKGLHSDKAWLRFFISMICPDTISLTTIVQPSKMEDWPSGTILLLIYSFFPDSFVPQAHRLLLLAVWHWRQTCFHCWRSRCVAGNWCTKNSQYHTSKQILESELRTAIHWTKHTLLYFSTSCLIGAPLSWVRATATPSWSYSSRHMQGYIWSPALEKSV